MISALVGMLPAWAAKAVGHIVLNVFKEIMARKDLKDSVRKELALAAEKNNAAALEFLARDGDPSIPVRDDAGHV